MFQKYFITVDQQNCALSVVIQISCSLSHNPFKPFNSLTITKNKTSKNYVAILNAF